MHIGRHIIQELTLQFGNPLLEHWDVELTREELDQVLSHRKRQRAHDVTLCIQRDSDIALIRKPGYPEGAFRLPSGGVHPEESFLDGARREALEETGLDVKVDQYPLRVHVRFFCGSDDASWATHVMCARFVSGDIAPIDRSEIEAAKWASWESLESEIGPILKASPKLGLGYRARLQDRICELRRLGQLNSRPANADGAE